MTQSSRRHFLRTSAAGAAALSGTQAFAQSPNLSQKAVSELETAEAQRDIESTASWKDGLDEFSRR